MKSVANVTRNARASVYSEDMFDGTAAREIGMGGHVILVDRRAPRAAHGDNRSRAVAAPQVCQPSFADDMRFAFEALGIKQVVRGTRAGAVSRREIPGATPAAIACVTGVMALVSLFVALL